MTSHLPTTKRPTSIVEAYRGSMPFVHSNTIYCTLHGSHAYGLNTETSDMDIKGVCLGPKNVYTGFSKGFEQAEGKDPYDLVIYELRKFFKLASNCNPNIIEVLFTEPSEVVSATPLGEKLVANRDAFLSLKARHTFAGYAKSQLGRINTHHRWLRNPPVKKPERADFGLGDNSVIPAEQLGAAITEIKKKIESFDFNWEVLEEADRIALKNSISGFFAEMKLTDDDIWTRTARGLGYNENFIEILKKERQYKGKLEEWTQYQHWLNTRNPKRAELEAKFGFDCKHASHLVRLLKMCKEIVGTGKVIVKRTEDREELLAIKNHGVMKYEEIVDWAEKTEKEIAILAKTSQILPKEPNYEFLDNLCSEIIEEFHFKK